MARLCERNKRAFYYATYVDSAPVIDAYGNETGGRAISYSEPTEMKGRVSATKGSAEIDLFGTNLNYNKTITVSDLTCPIDEYSKLWVDDTDTTHPHDYIVVGVAKDIDYIVYAIRRVNAE